MVILNSVLKPIALKLLPLLVLIFFFYSTSGEAQTKEEAVLKVVNEFFDTMEMKDSIGFNNLFLENAHAYSIRKSGDSTVTRSSVLKASTSRDKLKEQLQEKDITVHINGNVAAVWAPYDFWINNVHSHCGYEVFSFLKKDEEWKIASLTYSVEKDSCTSSK